MSPRILADQGALYPTLVLIANLLGSAAARLTEDDGILPVIGDRRAYWSAVPEFFRTVGALLPPASRGFPSHQPQQPATKILKEPRAF